MFVRLAISSLRADISYFLPPREEIGDVCTQAGDFTGLHKLTF